MIFTQEYRKEILPIQKLIELNDQNADKQYDALLVQIRQPATPLAGQEYCVLGVHSKRPLEEIARIVSLLSDRPIIALDDSHLRTTWFEVYDPEKLIPLIPDIDSFESERSLFRDPARVFPNVNLSG